MTRQYDKVVIILYDSVRNINFSHTNIHIARHVGFDTLQSVYSSVRQLISG